MHVHAHINHHWAGTYTAIGRYLGRVGRPACQSIALVSPAVALVGRSPPGTRWLATRGATGTAGLLSSTHACMRGSAHAPQWSMCTVCIGTHRHRARLSRAVTPYLQQPNCMVGTPLCFGPGTSGHTQRNAGSGVPQSSTYPRSMVHGCHRPNTPLEAGERSGATALRMKRTN